MVVGVEPFFHGSCTDITFFPLVTARQGKVFFKVGQVQGLNRLGHNVEEDSRVQNIVIVREVVAWNLSDTSFFDNLPVLSPQVFGCSQELFLSDFLTEVFFSDKFQFAVLADTREADDGCRHMNPPKK